MNKYLVLIISGSAIPAALLTLTFLVYYDFFTPVANENNYGIKATVMKWPPSWECPNICPEYEIRLSAEKNVAISEVYVCKVICLKQRGVVLDMVRMPYTNMAIESSFVPWHVGDNVEIWLKVSPIHFDGGMSYSDYEAKMVDLGISKVGAS